MVPARTCTWDGGAVFGDKWTDANNWSSNIAYRDFINQLMSVAVNRPPVTAGASLDGIMQAAVVDVLNNGLSSADAADKAIAALNR